MGSERTRIRFRLCVKQTLNYIKIHDIYDSATGALSTSYEAGY